ncbi:MAG: regulatory protein RecX [Candidatus Cryptobacteroides sp.]
MENLEMKKALTSLRNLCSRREYCASDIMEKAQKALDGNVRDAAEVVNSLVSDGFIDNRRYCAAFARDKSSLSGWGKAKISFALRQKGLSAEDIGYGLSMIDAPKADARLDRLVLNRIIHLKNDPEWRQKTIRFAMGRGYDYGEVSASLDRVSSSIGE